MLVFLHQVIADDAVEARGERLLGWGWRHFGLGVLDRRTSSTGESSAPHRVDELSLSHSMAP
jgi:hypothetical protein